MKNYIFLSPHYDDAVGSCGGMIARLRGVGNPVKIITIMGGGATFADSRPFGTGLSGADPRSGKAGIIRFFRRLKVRHRIRDNAAACMTVGAEVLNAPFLDAKHRDGKGSVFGHHEISESKLLDEIIKYIHDNTGPDDVIFAPSGLGNHIDHLIVAEAARRLDRKVYFYEEFYYDLKTGKDLNYEKIPLTPFELRIKISANGKYSAVRGLFSRHRFGGYKKYFRARPYEKFNRDPKIYSPKNIVSLTSFPARIEKLHLVIKSILRGSVQPDKIVLYLAKTQFAEKPKIDNVEIRWTDTDIRSYKKLAPALADFPDDNIITVDDDIIYPRDLLEQLLRRHLEEPTSIVGHRVRRIKRIFPYTNRNYKSIRKWRRFTYDMRPAFNNFATTGGGTFFPPHCLHPDATRADLFMKLAPSADDIWFWAMAVRGGTKIAPMRRGHYGIREIGGSQKQALRQENRFAGGGNDTAIKNVLDRWPELMEKLRAIK